MGSLTKTHTFDPTLCAVEGHVGYLARADPPDCAQARRDGT